MARRASLASGWYDAPLGILEQLFSGVVATQETVQRLTVEALADTWTNSVEGDMGKLWGTIITCARERPQHHDLLVDVLVEFTEMPDATTEDDKPLDMYDMNVWKDLPMLGRDLNEEWNGVFFEPGPEMQDVVEQFANINRLVALLVRTGKSQFQGNTLFALWTMRALECRSDKARPEQPIDAWVPAAASWVEILGKEMHGWTKEWESGPLIGAPGKGGPLWEGKHGFCRGRWMLWRMRFGELAKELSVISDQNRAIAAKAADTMKRIEVGVDEKA